VINNDRAIGK